MRIQNQASDFNFPLNPKLKMFYNANKIRQTSTILFKIEALKIHMKISAVKNDKKITTIKQQPRLREDRRKLKSSGWKY